MKRTVVVNRERNTPAVWGAVRVTTRGHAVEREQSHQRAPYKYQRSPCGLSDRRCSTAMIPRPWYLRGLFPVKGIQLAKTKDYSSDVHNRYILLPREKKSEKNEDCCSCDGARAGRGSPCAVLLPFFMAASSPYEAQSARSFACALVAALFQSVGLLPRL